MLCRSYGFGRICIKYEAHISGRKIRTDTNMDAINCVKFETNIKLWNYRFQGEIWQNLSCQIVWVVDNFSKSDGDAGYFNGVGFFICNVEKRGCVVKHKICWPVGSIVGIWILWIWTCESWLQHVPLVHGERSMWRRNITQEISAIWMMWKMELWPYKFQPRNIDVINERRK